jgi:Cu(I)/Ag(I) efflux system membrane fusion protein
MQSLPGRTFAGRVAFVDPSVDSRTRTVGVRVVCPNPQGILRVGDYATATVDLPVTGGHGEDLEPEVLVVPRNAVLLAGGNSVVYVETEPGRFELRRVVPGASNGDEIAILQGVAAGERVAVNGNFLIDSQMQLSGKPSLIDPAKAQEPALEVDGADEEPVIRLRPTDLPPMDLPMVEVTP